MATYLILFKFTQQGIERIKDLPKRVENAKQIIKNLGGETVAFYGILGSEYDTMTIVHAPSEEKLASMVLTIGKLGNVRTHTHRLFSEEELKGVLSAVS